MAMKAVCPTAVAAVCGAVALALGEMRADREGRAGPMARSVAGLATVVGVNHDGPSPRHSDLEDWIFWYQYVLVPRLDARARAVVRAAPWFQAPTVEDVQMRVLPRLANVLAEDRNAELSAAALEAWGRTTPYFEDAAAHLKPVRARLDDERTVVAEAARLALGVSRAPVAARWLLTSARADGQLAKARELAAERMEGFRDTPPVIRRLAFALYGLGLIAARVDGGDAAQIRSGLAEFLDGKHDYEVRIAAGHALSLCHGAQREPAIGALQRALTASPPPGPFVRAHLLVAVGRLLRAPAVGEAPQLGARRAAFQLELTQHLARSLEDGDSAEFPARWSAVAALGRTTRTASPSPLHDDVVAVLRRCAEQESDAQTLGLARVALAEIGGREQMEFLAGLIGRRVDPVIGGWTESALGIVAAGGDPEDPLVTRLTEHLLAEVGRAEAGNVWSASIAALGLLGDSRGVDALRTVIERFRNRDFVCGLAAVSLGLLDDRDSLAELRRLSADSRRRPMRLSQALKARIHRGDETLIAELAEPPKPDGVDENLAHVVAQVVSAGCIGDRRLLPPLLDRLSYGDGPPVMGVIAALTIGTLLAPDVPWSVYADHVAARNRLPTLSDSQNGILDRW